MKKFFALLLALCMIFALAACGEPASEPSEAPASEAPASEAPASEAPADESEAPADESEAPEDGDAAVITDPNEIPNDAESADGTYEVAFVTDVGQLQDGSFNEGTWNGVKLYAANNGLTYKYYQPANGNEATDDDRVNAMQAAVDAGAKVVVCAGFLQEAALRTAAINNPDVNFVFIDGYPLDDDPDPNVTGNILTNVAGINFQEEQCGYLAGYAVVKEGFTKLGFTGGGGGTNPACCRYGYGFVQGADAAAKELGVKVDMNYSWQYGASFSASPELQTMVSGWYEAGTEVVFACGGSMFASVAAAAGAADGKVVGVDVDQSTESDTVITSAMKGLADSVQWALGKFYSNEFASIGGVGTSLGANENAVGLPTATWSLTKWTVDEYNTMLKDIVGGKITIDSDYNNLKSTDNVTLNII